MNGRFFSFDASKNCLFAKAWSGSVSVVLEPSFIPHKLRLSVRRFLATTSKILIFRGTLYFSWQELDLVLCPAHLIHHEQHLKLTREIPDFCQNWQSLIIVTKFSGISLILNRKKDKTSPESARHKQQGEMIKSLHAQWIDLCCTKQLVLGSKATVRHV